MSNCKRKTQRDDSGRQIGVFAISRVLIELERRETRRLAIAAGVDPKPKKPIEKPKPRKRKKKGDDEEKPVRETKDVKVAAVRKSTRAQTRTSIKGPVPKLAHRLVRET